MSTTAALPTEIPAAAAKPRSGGWIISPLWDALLFVATPLLIWPTVGALRWFWSAETIWLLAISFASFGHHLPGFLRSYLDPELFARFFWRFVLVPPLIFGTCLLFQAQGWHGVQVAILIWATWHGLMQTYGFLRIYDLKSGNNHPLTAHLDFALCVMMFVAGAIFSQSRVFFLCQAAWQAGLPMFWDWQLPLVSLNVLQATQGAVAAGTVLVAAAYVWHLVGQARAGQRVGGTKLAVAVSTAWIWWLSGAAGTHVLVGIAMFEIFHAVQYLAIVWVFNQKVAERLGPRAGLLRYVFGKSWPLLFVYLSLIAAYGALRFFGQQWNENLSWPWLTHFALAVLGASTILHYYFDGFIWKVREQSNRQTLNLESSPQTPKLEWTSAGRHCLKWLLFFGPVFGLAAAQVVNAQHRTPEQNLQVAQSLATLADRMPEAQQHLASSALATGQGEMAVSAANRSVELRPDWPLGWATLGNAQLLAGEWQSASKAFERAIEFAPAEADYHYNLGSALSSLGDWTAAEAAYQRAIELNPDQPNYSHDLGTMYGLWAMELWQSGQQATAMDRAKQALALRSDWDELHYQLGLWQREIPQLADAQRSFQTALAINPSMGKAHYQLSQVLWQQVQPRLRFGLSDGVEEKLTTAQEHLQRARELGVPVSLRFEQHLQGVLEQVRATERAILSRRSDR